MPDAELIKVADAIATDISAAFQAGQFADMNAYVSSTPGFAAERSYADWANDLDEMEHMRVDVVPISYDTAELADVGSVQYDCTTHVGVRFWFSRLMQVSGGKIDRAKIDRLVLFVQELTEFFCRESGRRLPSYPTAAWKATKIQGTYNRKYLRDKRMFFALLRVTYTVFKDL